jgi:hypothetical protein
MMAGCVSEAERYCREHPGFSPLRVSREVEGVYWEHVVVTNGHEVIDPSPWNDKPDELSDWDS